MPRIFTKLSSVSRSVIGRTPLQRSPSGEEGFLLVEVIISAMLVGLIVIATLTGFDVTNRVTSEQRHRNEAAVLAAESQEALRSDPASALDEIQGMEKGHEYSRTVDGTVYTIKQTVGYVNDKEPEVSCEASDATQSNQNGNYLRITSVVTWPAQKKNNRPAVKQSSIITPPVGSAIEVDVGNEPNPTAGVSGVTAVVKYTPISGAGSATLEATTGTPGCVIFGGIPSTEASLEILEKVGFVTPSGALKWPPKELTIAPNLTTHEAVTLNEGGTIKAEFAYKGSTSANVLGKGTEKVEGDTFVAFNAASEGSEFEVGSTGFEYELIEEEKYAAKTGGYATAAETAGPGTPGASKYPHGDLFPFNSSKWAVYAGDCPANDTGKEAEVTGGATVEPGQKTTVKVPLSYSKLNVWTGSTSGPSQGVASKELLPVKITNTACSGAATPNNAWGTNYVHKQELTSEGHLKFPFQPFGAATLCVASATNNRTYSIGYMNTAATNPERNIYLGQKSSQERAAQAAAEVTAKEVRAKEETEATTAKTAREKAESEATTAKKTRETEETNAKTAKTAREKAESEAITAKTKREKEENEATTAKTKRATEETEMAGAKTAREKEEKTKRETWLSEEASKKITKAQRTTKETEQTTARTKKEGEEKTAKEKRTKEETEAKAPREKREKEETEATTAKTKRATEETEAKAAKTAREKAETEATAAKEKRGTEETEAKTAKTAREKAETEATAAKKAREKEEEAEAGNKVTVATGSTC